MAFFIFDVDGVLTDELARPDPIILEAVNNLYKRGDSIAFITGRSRTWLEEHIFSGLDPRQDWSGLYCVAEHGAIKGMGMDINHWKLDTSFVIEEDANDQLQELSKKEQYRGLIEWDETKETMGTVEAVHGDPDDRKHLKENREALKDYSEQAKEIAEAFDKKIAVSTYGVDVTPPELSKEIGAAWIFEQGFDRKQPVYVFGDSESDWVMAETAADFGAENITFYWVGEGSFTGERTERIKVQEASTPFSAGTKELLNELRIQELNNK